MELTRIIDMDRGVSGSSVFGIRSGVKEILGTWFTSDDL